MNDSLIKAKYIIAFDNFSITNEIRNEVINNTLMPDAHLETNLLVCIAKKVIDGYNVDKAVQYLSEEHVKLGFYDKYQINKEQWEQIATIGFEEIAKNSDLIIKADRLIQILPSITDYALNIGLSLIILDHIVGMGKVGENLDFTKELIKNLEGVDIETIPGMPMVKSLTSLIVSTNFILT